MNYVFFGNNVPLAERLRKALGTGVIECITLLQMKNTLLPAEEMDYCVFIEKTFLRSCICIRRFKIYISY